MGLSASFEYICDVISRSYKHKLKKKKMMKEMQTVNLKVRMDCDGCELKVKKALSSLSGVKSVEINRKQQKVRVRGYIEQSKVLKKAKSTGKKAEMWPYVPYNLVAQPYAPGAYDIKAPPGFVRKLDNALSFDDHPYVTIFSDDNPNSCFIM
ncbi:heavy metal-associated isoprenylated plant protein 23-like isoform X1 [Salvia miltiorrhiza]|uniref:heavy metal-associated isoprenylated plant protein 23-like isoform X1 n=1 Tax=Salvia miltiorrhiza TaxID=226208 RepID=UPI0025ABFFC1|nr:heavy metal-associated isoprenylated plant protein 23-like isoform X1 [Salvia miltiorrhiza]